MKKSAALIIVMLLAAAPILRAQSGLRILGAQQFQVDDNNPLHPRIYITNNLGALGIDQNGVVTPGVFPSPCALLDLSSSTQGFLPPRMTGAEELLICGGTPTEGLVTYNTTTHTLDIWNGTTWTGQWQTKGNTNLTVDNTDNLFGSTASSTVKPFNFIVGGTRIARYQTNNDIVGGAPNNAINGTTANAVIGGGTTNTIATNSNNAVVAGGANNTASAAGAAVLGGGFDGTTLSGNTASGGASVVVGGITNTASGIQSFVGGGQNNSATNNNAMVGGGVNNLASGTGSVVSGGGYYNGFVSGNTASGGASFVGGGITNLASGPQAVVGGGQNNHATNNNATIGGGVGNVASGYGSVVAGGGYNGGSVLGNIASGHASFVGGGMNNSALGIYSVVTGGLTNSAGSSSSIVGGGSLTLGDNSFGYNNPTAGANVAASPNTAYFGNVNLWLGNTNNTAQQFRMYAPNSSTIYAGAFYTSLQASSATIATTQYAMPVDYGSSVPPSVSPYLLADLSGAGTPRQLTWQSANQLGWLLNGNSGTTAANFIGTTDNTDFVIRTNNLVRATFAGTPVGGGVKPALNINTTAGFQGVRINGIADAIAGPGGSTLVGTPDVWELAVVGDFVASGIVKMGGSMWFDGNSPTHLIAANQPLSIQVTTPDPLSFATAGTTRMTVTAAGKIGVGTSNPASQFTVSSAPPDPTITNSAGFYTPDPVNHVMTVENTSTSGKGNGIAIIIHNPSGSSTPNLPNSDGAYNNNSSNYVTFYNDNGTHSHIKGRIEGFSYENYSQLAQAIGNITSSKDVYNPFSYFTCNIGFDTQFLNNAYNSNFIQFTAPTFPSFDAGSFPSLTAGSVDWQQQTITFPQLNGGTLPSSSGGSVGSLNFSSPYGAISSPLTNLTSPFAVDQAYVDGIASQIRALAYPDRAIEIVTNPLAAAVKYGTSFLGGVTYESGSGDYAEWLERADHNEKVTIGDVVGVVGGRISKNTVGAKQLMVVSWKPAVLGNMPEEGKEQFYHKVAFMGQVPVKMMCPVKKGDYIVPDGRNDGFAKAISPVDMTAEQLENVLGVSWEDHDGYDLKFVKIAVGLKPHEMVKVIQDQAKAIEELKSKVSDLESLKAEIESLRSVVESSTGKHTKRRQMATKK